MNFKTEFEQKLKEHDLTYDIRGMITSNRRIYPLGTDTKVISTAFEMICRPLVHEVAVEHGLQVREASAQNIYPDFTLMQNEKDRHKIAVDVKTTYRETDDNWRVTFTLGSYTSFIRSESSTKNIEFPYEDYAEEWIIGFIYKRKSVEAMPAHIFDLDNLADIPLPFGDVDVFIQEKWRIAGETAGSGNTTNIGSIRGTLDDFRQGKTPFRSKKEFLAYWCNYGKTAEERKKRYHNLATFREWQKHQTDSVRKHS